MLRLVARGRSSARGPCWRRLMSSLPPVNGDGAPPSHTARQLELHQELQNFVKLKKFTVTDSKKILTQLDGITTPLYPGVATALCKCFIYSHRDAVHDHILLKLMDVLRRDSLGRMLSPEEVAECMGGLRRFLGTSQAAQQFMLFLSKQLLLSPLDSERLKSKHIGFALSGIVNMSSKTFEVRQLIGAFAMQLERCVEPLSSFATSSGLFGLQGCDSQSSEVGSLLVQLERLIALSKEPMSYSDLESSMRGLRFMSSDVPAVRGILAAVHRRVKSKTSSMTSKQFGFIVNGLMSMHNRHPEVAQLLSFALARVLRTSVTAEDIGLAVFGLRNMEMQKEVAELFITLTEKLNECPDPLNSTDVTNMLVGLKSMSSEHAEIRNFLSSLVVKILRSNSSWSFLNISKAFSAIKNMTVDCEEVRSFLVVMCSVLRNERSGIIPSRSLASCLYAMKLCTSDVREVRELLMELAFHLNQCATPFSAQGIGLALHGLCGMSNEEPEVLVLLHAFVNKIKKDGIVALDAKAIGSALYGFRNMNSKSKEVLQLLRLIGQMVEQCKEPLSDQEISNALYGLQGMTSDHGEVRRLIELLSVKIEEHDVAFSSMAVGMAFYGLQSMKYDNVEVKKMVYQLTTKLEDAQGNMTPKFQTFVLFGLQNMPSSDATIRRALRALSKRLHRKYVYHEFELVTGYIGLRSMSGTTPEVHFIIKFLNSMTRKVLEETKDKDIISEKELNEIFQLHQSLLFCVSTFESLPAESQRDVIELAGMLSERIRDSRSRLKAISSSVDNKLLSVLSAQIKPASDSHGVTWKENEYLFGFEAKLLLFVDVNEKRASAAHGTSPSGADAVEPSQEQIIVNFEISVGSYKSPAARSFFALRDAYLENNYNVIVVRLHLNEIDEDHLERRVMNLVRASDSWKKINDRLSKFVIYQN